MEDRLWAKRRRLLYPTVEEALAGIALFANISVGSLQVWLHTYVSCMRAWLVENYSLGRYDCPLRLELADVVCFYAVIKAWMLGRRRGPLNMLTAAAVMTLVWAHLYLETTSPTTAEAAALFRLPPALFTSLYVRLAVELSAVLVQVMTLGYNAVEAELAYLASVATSRSPRDAQHALDC